ncbi:hypothetical protein JCM16358_10580 [Halanaerocella petrolearia]
MYDSFTRNMVRAALGPHGRAMADFYLEHQFIINGLVVGLVIIKKLLTHFSNKKEKDNDSKPFSEEELNYC